MLRIRQSNSTLLTGFVRKSSVPGLEDASKSAASLRAVTIKISNSLVFGFANLPADLEARESGHHHIEQEEIGRELLDYLEGFLAVEGRPDLSNRSH